MSDVQNNNMGPVRPADEEAKAVSNNMQEEEKLGSALKRQEKYSLFSFLV
jgi:hypothetical protein